MNTAGIIDLVPAALRRRWAQDGTYPNKPVFTLFAEKASAFPDKPAVLSIVTYGDLLNAALRLANSLGRTTGFAARLTWRLPRWVRLSLHSRRGAASSTFSCWCVAAMPAPSSCRTNMRASIDCARHITRRLDYAGFFVGCRTNGRDQLAGGLPGFPRPPALVGGRGRFLQRISPANTEFRGLYLVPLGSSFGSTATFGVLCD